MTREELEQLFCVLIEELLKHHDKGGTVTRELALTVLHRIEEEWNTVEK